MSQYVNLHNHSEFCLDPSVRVINADSLEWKRIDEVNLGEELVGFDEDLRGAPGKKKLRGPSRCKMRRTTVESISKIVRDCYRITFEDGSNVIASDTHGWVGTGVNTRGCQIKPWVGERRYAGRMCNDGKAFSRCVHSDGTSCNTSENTRRWLTTEQLVPGKTRIVLWAKPWDQIDPSEVYASAWLAGVADGESNLNNGQFSFNQCDGPVLDYMKKCCDILGYNRGKDQLQSSGLNNPLKSNKLCYTFRLNSYTDILKFLSQCKPKRFMPRSDEVWVGRRAGSKNLKPLLVTDLEFLGPREVIGIQTSTRTFVAEGLLSHNSLLDGYSKPSDIVRLTKEMGQPAACITDHGTLAATLKLYKAGLEYEQKVIIGNEIYVTENLQKKDKDSSTWHLILLAKNKVGLENLYSISQIGWEQGFYKKPRVDKRVLNEYSEGIICISGCMASETSRAIRENDISRAALTFNSYLDIFGEDYYAETQPGNSVELNTAIVDLAQSLGIKSVVTIDSHYDVVEHRLYEELLLLLQQLPSIKASDKKYAEELASSLPVDMPLLDKINALWPNRNLRYDALDLYMQEAQEVKHNMEMQGLDAKDLMQNTLEVADKCEPIEFKLGGSYLPQVVPEHNSDTFLKELCINGLKNKNLYEVDGYTNRLSEELSLIFDKKFSDYFLLCWDIINFCRINNIYVGPGRGSAAGSLVTYSLGITSVDPIKAKLLFFRFLNPERNDWPDIDMDIEPSGRELVKHYLRDKYGEAVGITTFGSFQGKSTVKDVSRCFGISTREQNDVTKKFTDLDDFIDSSATAYYRNRYPEVVIASKKITGHIKSSGAHAGAVVVADRPFSKIVPIETRKDPDNEKLRVPVTAFDMEEVAELGLIKMDLLGLLNLTIIHEAVDAIYDRHELRVDWENLEPDDQKVLQDIGRGNTTGIFQMESSQYRRLLVDMGVDSFEDLVASNALVRPGAYNTVAKDYIKRKRGLDQVRYPHESVEEELKDTYGLYIYQEQVMQLAVKLGGFTWAEADKLRKIIGKKKDVAEFKPYFDHWMGGATSLISAKAAEKMWHDFEAHAGYSFNRSHAYCYSYIGYVTAWLKLNYTTEYMYAMLKHEKSETTRMSYLIEADRLKMPIKIPDVNTSVGKMQMTSEGALEFGLGDIKGVGTEAVNELLTKRPFVSYEALQESVEARKVNAKVLTALEHVGALQGLSDAPEHDYQSYWLELLRYPTNMEQELVKTTPLEEMSETTKDFHLVSAVVKSAKRTETYFRLELEDTTGTYTCFADKSNDLSSGDLCTALVGDRTMLGYFRNEGIQRRLENGQLTKFEQFILTNKIWEPFGLLIDLGIDGIDAPKSLIVPLNTREIVTKTGKTMGFSYVTDRYLNILKLTLFPSQWATMKDKLSEWTPLCVKLSPLRNGSGWTLEDGWIDRADLVLKKKLAKL